MGGRSPRPLETSQKSGGTKNNVMHINSTGESNYTSSLETIKMHEDETDNLSSPVTSKDTELK